MFIKRDVSGCEAIREALIEGEWMSKTELAKATGFSWSLVSRRTRQMAVRGELHEKPQVLPGGGRIQLYKLVEGWSAVEESGVVWEVKELAEAFGGMTFPPPGFTHPEPTVRHHLFH